MSEDDDPHWRASIADVTPYDAPPEREDTKAPRKRDVKHIPHRPSRPAPRAIGNPLHDISEGAFIGVDKATVKKLKRGQLPIDATLDLHGLTQQAAYDALESCIMRARTRRQRVLLVITGKGRLSEPGALKSALPRWLNDDRLRPYLLAFETARREDGGSGAYYVLLRREKSRPDE